MNRELTVTIERIQAFIDAASTTRPLDEFDHENQLYVYGAGELGSLAVDYFERCALPVSAVLDRDRKGFMQGRERQYEILNPFQAASAAQRRSMVAVAVVTSPYEPIRNALRLAGWSRVVPFYSFTSEPRYGHPLSSGWLVGQVSSVESDAVVRICKRWRDAESLMHYEAFVAWHTCNSELLPAPNTIVPEDRYRIEPLVKFLGRRHKQYVDVGACRGEAVARLHAARVGFTDYVLIEPDDESRAILKAGTPALVGNQMHRIVPDVIGSSHGKLPFADGFGYSSQIWQHGSCMRQVIPLDALALTPDLIKIHTEGTEGDVLDGAVDTIDRARPAIVFSIYHNRDGFCRTIDAAMNRFDGYCWFFRLHSYQGTGGFVYGIPYDQ